MPYATTNPPRMVSGALYGAGMQWFYSSADTAATVDTAGYITNGYDLGMRVGDQVIVQVTGTGALTMHRVVSVTVNGAADLGDGTIVGATTNTD